MLKSNINLNLYKTFYDVARYGSFSKAAEFTYTTQPAISKSIKKLEAELETELFYRKSNGIELTEKGRELLFYVEKSYGNLLTAERILLETEELNRGNLSIGIPSNLYNFYLLDKIIDFRKKYPNIEITIITGPTSYLLNQLEIHKVDFIIDTGPIVSMNNEFFIKKLENLSYSFVALNNEKYTKIKSIKDLEKESLILPLNGTFNRSSINELFLKNNIKPNNIINIHTSEMIIDTIKKDIGIGYILKDVVKDYITAGEFIELNIKEELPYVELIIIYNKKFLTNAPKKFIELYLIK